MNIRKKFLMFGLLLYLTIGGLRFASFDYFKTSSFMAYNNDTFYWTWCALQLAEHGKVDFFDTRLFSNLQNPYFQGCFFSPGYTFIALILFKIFGITILPLQIVLFLAYLLTLILVYEILKYLFNDRFVRNMTFLVFVLNPYSLLFSFAVRPDTLAFLFAVLSALFALKSKTLLSALSFITSVLVFKQNYVILLFVIIYFLFLSIKLKGNVRKLRDVIAPLLKFIIPIALIFAVYYFTIYLYVKTNFPEMVEYLSKSNTSTLSSYLKTDRFHLLIYMPFYFGMPSLIGMIYFMGTILTLPITGGIAEIVQRRALTHLFLMIGIGEISSKMKNLGRIFITFTVIYTILISIHLVIADFKAAYKENEYMREIIKLGEKNLICSMNSPASGFTAYLFHQNTNLIYRFDKNLATDLSTCDIIYVPDVRINQLLNNKFYPLFYNKVKILQVPSHRKYFKESLRFTLDLFLNRLKNPQVRE